MNNNRIWIIGSVIVMVALIALGWVLGIQPQLTATAIALEDRTAVERVNAAHEASIASLKKDFEGIEELNQELTTLSKSVPFGSDVPDYLDQLDALAIAHNVTIKGVTVADATAYATVPLVAPATPPAATGSSPSPTPTPAPEGSPDATVELVPAPGAPPITNEKITPETFASLGVQIVISGSYSDVLNFVNGLQTGQRLFLVTGLATEAEEQNAGVPQSSTAANDFEELDVIPSGAVEGTISGLIYSIVTDDIPLEEGAG